MGSKNRTTKVEIHTLAAVPRRTWVMEGGPGGRVELHVTPMKGCTDCVSHGRRGFTGCRLCGVVHCECCADATIALLAVDHTHGGGLLCAGCIVAKTIGGRCEHRDTLGKHTVIRPPVEAEPAERRPER